jgi:hypothetical protein
MAQDIGLGASRGPHRNLAPGEAVGPWDGGHVSRRRPLR